MLKYIKKDITTLNPTKPIAIMHGVNCQGVMGSGIAKALYTKWPKVRSDYMRWPVLSLGGIRRIVCSKNIVLFNCYTQENYGRDGKVYASPLAIEDCLQKVIKWCRISNITSIYSPKIGCGLGGLSWVGGVDAIFEDLSKKFPDIDINVCSL